MTSEDLSPALTGLRVVEVSAFVAAPLGGMTLSQLGADVIRIDAIGGGLDYRRWPVTSDNESLFWRGLNKGKRSVAIDITSAEGRELAMALVVAPGPDAGVLLTNFPARGWLSHATLLERRGDLIQLTVQGDRHGASAVDYTVNPRVGIPYLTGEGADDDVVNHVLPAWDLVTGQMAAIGILAAERQRRRTGRGQEVRLALEDVALAMVSHLGFLAEAQLGQTRPRVGNHLFGAFGKDFTCASGQRVMVVALTGKQWHALCAATLTTERMDEIGSRLGLDLQREGDRFAARIEIAACLDPWFATRSFDEVKAAFDRNGVCWGPYQTIRQLVDSDPACSESNPMFRTIVQPGVGRVLAAGTPLDFDAQARVAPRPAPRLGEHTEQVLLEVLGMPAAALGRLVDRGVVALAADI